ncbi:MAG: bifunctional 4-hydroxy-2-oxoglutarate aldolase/2-dehydro-3-deoxy-phosphogluconate aldolase [Candidatus Methylomirabilales bacterium]
MGVDITIVDEQTEHILAGGIIAILRPERTEDLLPVAEAIRAGGVTAIEVTPTAPGAVQALGPARMKLGRDVVLGLGSVLTAEAARDALQAGVAFVAAPNLNPEVIRVCREARVSVIPGAFTATEIVQAWGLGASIVKVFPAVPAGAGYIKEILSTLPDVRLAPTGGISLQNVGDFIRAGAAAVGVGDEIVSKDLLAQREFSEITRRARAFVEAVQRARGQVARPMQPVRPIEGPDVR